MIAQVIYLKEYDWLVKVYYAVDQYYKEEILNELYSIDCLPEALNRAADMLENYEINTGFTYTDNSKHLTFIIIGLTDSVEEFFNTFIHELGHASVHIAEYYDLRLNSEKMQYLQGELGLEMFSVAKNFLCEHCRNMNFYNFGKVKIKIKKGD